MSRKVISIEDTLCITQKSDSEKDVDSFGESSEPEMCDVDSIQDLDFETKNKSECDDSSILQSLSRKRAWYTNEYMIFESQSGRKWMTKNNIAAKTLSATILQEKSRLAGNTKKVSNKFDSQKLFLTSDIINVIVQETNRRAKKVIASWNSEHLANKKLWKETDETELYAFIVLLLLRGVN